MQYGYCATMASSLPFPILVQQAHLSRSAFRGKRVFANFIDLIYLRVVTLIRTQNMKIAISAKNLS
jgi:hypothetical protein